jgi:hypothetical protein
MAGMYVIVAFVVALVLGVLSLSVGLAWVANLLAKDKGADVRMWTLLGAIPGVNLFAMLYFIGTPDRRTSAWLHRQVIADNLSE